MSRLPFTVSRISAFGCPPDKRQALMWCGKTPGLGLRATPAGAKTFVFEARLHGRTIRTTIGSATAWTIGEAQAEARRLKTEVDRGIDPRESAAELKVQAEKKRTEAKRAEITVGAAWETYTKDRAPKWGKRHHANITALTRSVAAATKVITRGTSELVEAVKEGTVSVSAAAQIASLPKQEQVAAMEAPKAKLSKPPQPAQKADDDLQHRYDELLDDYRHEVDENERLRERIKGLTADDQKAEIDKALLRVHALESRLQQAMTTSNEAQRQASLGARTAAKPYRARLWHRVMDTQAGGRAHQAAVRRPVQPDANLAHPRRPGILGTKT